MEGLLLFSDFLVQLFAESVQIFDLHPAKLLAAAHTGHGFVGQLLARVQVLEPLPYFFGFLIYGVTRKEGLPSDTGQILAVVPLVKTRLFSRNL